MPIDWDRIRQTALTSVTPPSNWPAGVRPISQDGLALLGVGEDGALYLDGQRLALSREIKFSSAERWIAGIAALGVLLVGGAAMIEALIRLVRAAAFL